LVSFFRQSFEPSGLFHSTVVRGMVLVGNGAAIPGVLIYKDFFV
jgi:hypothetical protein